MKFADRSAKERTAIDAWIRLTMLVRENAYMKVADGFREARRERICELPGDIENMLFHYAAYQAGHHTASFAQYFEAGQPDAYAALLLSEKAADGVAVPR